MGAFAFDEENSSTVAPATLYKALTKDADTIIPKIIGAIQTIEIVEGNGGPGTVKKITANEGQCIYIYFFFLYISDRIKI